MLCAKNWDCGNPAPASEARRASFLSFSQAHFSFEPFEFKKPRKHGVLAGFLRLWVGGCEEVGVLNIAVAKARSRNLSVHILLIGRFSVQ